MQAAESVIAPLAHIVPDACRRIGISRTVLYEMIAAGRIRPVKLGARTLIPESELQRFLSELMQEAA